MELLKKLETDGTWSQDQQSDRVMAKAGPESCSFDLTSATDRFPLLPQRLVVSQLFGGAIGESWAGLMTDRTFIIKNVGTAR